MPLYHFFTVSLLSFILFQKKQRLYFIVDYFDNRFAFASQKHYLCVGGECNRTFLFFISRGNSIVKCIETDCNLHQVSLQYASFHALF